MQNRIRRPIALFTAIALMNATACYSYLPIATEASPNMGERVRMTLTHEGTTELARFLGPRVTMAEGELSAMTPGGDFVVAVDFVQTVDGIRQPWSGEGMVTIPKTYVTSTRQRTFLKRQTVVATTLITVLLIVVARIALNSGVFGGDGGGGGVVNP